jgi:hypothetical protein
VGVVASFQLEAVEKLPPAVLLKSIVHVGDAAAVPLNPMTAAMLPMPESPSTKAHSAGTPIRRKGPTFNRLFVVRMALSEDPRLRHDEAKCWESNGRCPMRPATLTVRHCPLTFLLPEVATREGRQVPSIRLHA